MKKIFIFIFCLFVFNSGAIAKETTFKKELFDKALAEQAPPQPEPAVEKKVIKKTSLRKPQKRARKGTKNETGQKNGDQAT